MVLYFQLMQPMEGGQVSVLTLESSNIHKSGGGGRRKKKEKKTVFFEKGK
jgi:hypothetical protein